MQPVKDVENIEEYFIGKFLFKFQFALITTQIKPL